MLSTSAIKRLRKSFEAQKNLDWMNAIRFFLNSNGSTQVVIESVSDKDLINVLGADSSAYLPVELDTAEIRKEYVLWVDETSPIKVPVTLYGDTIKAMDDAIAAEDARAAAAEPPYNPTVNQWYVDLVNNSNLLKSLKE
ncbi:hypothetical protein [Vibrio phage Va2]|nr:hypothetical protein [Vibrio phage Va2]